jgi:hypothetical protein
MPDLVVHMIVQEEVLNPPAVAVGAFLTRRKPSGQDSDNDPGRSFNPPKDNAKVVGAPIFDVPASYYADRFSEIPNLINIARCI